MASALAQDITYWWRTTCKNSLFTSIAVLSFALGIGANTAIYSVMDAVMFRTLPVQNPEQLVILNWRASRDPAVIYHLNGDDYNDPGIGKTSPVFPWPAYELLRTQNSTLSELFAYKDAASLNLMVHGHVDVGPVEFVSGTFFAGLRVQPAMGRLIINSDDSSGKSEVAVLSYNYWSTRFGADSNAIGQTIYINNRPFVIIGVTAPEFFGVTPGIAPLVFLPIVNRLSLSPTYSGKQAPMFIDQHFYWVNIMGRLRSGCTHKQAQAELGPAFHRFALSSAANEEQRANLPALWLEDGGAGVDSLRRQFSKPLSVLMAMTALILAIACANVANLLLSRAIVRRREISVRLSLGASRLRLVQQFLTESVMLALLGGLIGLAMAFIGVRSLILLLADRPEHLSVPASIDLRILLMTIAVTVSTGVLFGLAPAIQASGVDIISAFRQTPSSKALGRGRRVSLSQLLVVFEIALSLLLVFGAVLFVRTLSHLYSVETGFNKNSLLTFDLDASQVGYKDSALKAFYGRVLDRCRVLPGVNAATITDLPLAEGSAQSTGIFLQGALDNKNHIGTSYVSVGPSYFETMQLPILLGRPIDSRDVEASPLTAVVNQVFVQRYFPSKNPIGQHFGLGNPRFDMTIVGVARNARYGSLKDAIPPVAYVSYSQNNLSDPPLSMTFEIRTSVNSHGLFESIRQIIHEIAPAVPVTNMMSHAERIDRTINQERTFAGLCSVFAILALVIACVGLYGVTSYTLSLRTNEIGIRMALGSSRGKIIWLLLREVLALALAGITTGLVFSWTAITTLKPLVFGLDIGSPTTILLATAVLVISLLLAICVPARRASRIAPLTALRY